MEFSADGGLKGHRRSENSLALYREGQAGGRDMSILSPDPEKDSVDGVPPAALGVILHADLRTRDLLNEKDAFGFPLHATLLERYDMRPELEALAQGVAETLSRLLGPKQARRIMSEALKQANKGKSDNREQNEARLAAYDDEIAAGTPRRRAARRAAEKILQVNMATSNLSPNISAAS